LSWWRAPVSHGGAGLFAVVGVGNVLIDISAFSAVPRVVPDRALAGVFGLLEALFQIGLALGAVTAGVLLHLFGARIALLVVGLLLPAAALIAAPLLHRFDVRLAHHDVEVELLRRQPLVRQPAHAGARWPGCPADPCRVRGRRADHVRGRSGRSVRADRRRHGDFHSARSRGKRPAHRLSLRRSRSCATSPEQPRRRQPRRSRRGPSTARHSLPHWGAIHMPEPQPKRWPTSTSRDHPPLTVAELRDSGRTPDRQSPETVKT
jgi:hypothetical protein